MLSASRDTRYYSASTEALVPKDAEIIEIKPVIEEFKVQPVVEDGNLTTFQCAFLLITLTSASFLVLTDASIIAPVSMNQDNTDRYASSQANYSITGNSTYH